MYDIDTFCEGRNQYGYNGTKKLSDIENQLVERKKRLVIARKGLMTKGKSTYKVDSAICDVILAFMMISDEKPNQVQASNEIKK